MKTSKRSMLLTSLMMAAFAPGMAMTPQDAADRDPRSSIRVTGEATVSARPDQALIDVGVVTQADNAQAAAAQNAQRADSVLTELRKVLGPGTELKTINYTVTPNYRYPKEGGRPSIVGYSVTNVVRVQVNDLARVGNVVDAATQSGANTIHRLQFRMKDERVVQEEALRQAAALARAKADAIASALGVRIVKVLAAEEAGGPIFHPMEDRMFATAKAEMTPPTPIEAGTLEFRAVVNLTVEVSN
jgi:uncharacterized protein YggE